MRSKAARLTEAFLVMLGALFFGILVHEFYHFVTLHNVTQACIEFGGRGTMFVSGEGNSSEIVAHSITLLITLTGIIFAVANYIDELRNN